MAAGFGLSSPQRPLVCLALLFASQALAGEAPSAPPPDLPTLDQALAAKQDVWGLAATRQPNGPSYEFFEKLLPPLRYVNAAFHHYPIVLSAPGSAQKARLISNGSAINARADLKTWKDTGVPVTFRVGDDHELFGEDLDRLYGPRYEQGYLPMVELKYEHDGATYEQEDFASVEPT